MPLIVVRSPSWPRILAEELHPLAEPLALVLTPRAEAPPAAVAAAAARALLDLPPVAADAWPPWLAPHQVPAARRITALVRGHGGAVLADAVGLGKSYVALAVAQALARPTTLVVPGVLVAQWRALLDRLDVRAAIITHESLSRAPHGPTVPPSDGPTAFVVDEAHRFRNPGTHRYGALARLVVGAAVLLVTATPVHNRLGDLFHLFRLFLRDHALAALGVPSLRRAARGDLSPERAAAAAARFVVSRSRERVRGGYGGAGPLLRFPARSAAHIVRASAAPEALVEELVAKIRRLAGAGDWTPLLRLLLLRRLASSLPALRATLDRAVALLDVSRQAAAEGRALSRAEFQRLFPAGDAPDLQLALFPVVLDAGGTAVAGDREALAALRALAAADADPKADALVALLASHPAKTIVFTDARPTVRHLLRRLRASRGGRGGRGGGVAAVLGPGGVLGDAAASRAEALRAFAPVAQGAAAPPAALEADVLVATDLVSEGLNLQDAARVVHYDLPWTAARLAQRVGRIDRLGSPHHTVETVSFLPPAVLADALALEQRLAAKARAQVIVGAADVEGVSGRRPAAAFDWCDRLQRLAHDPAAAGGYATIAGIDSAVALVVRVGDLVDALVVSADGVESDPVRATACLEAAAQGSPLPTDGTALEWAIRRAAPLVRARLAAVQDARWRAGDRDRLSRRLIPWVLATARRAARRGDALILARLDGLVARLSLGMTAGEELLLSDLVERPEPLAMADLLAWHEGLSAAEPSDAIPQAELVGAVVVTAARTPC